MQRVERVKNVRTVQYSVKRKISEMGGNALNSICISPQRMTINCIKVIFEQGLGMKHSRKRQIGTEWKLR